MLFNLLVALAAVVAIFFEPAKDFVQENAVLIMSIIGAVNMGLRRITNQAVALFPLLMAGLCLALTSCLISCNSPYGSITPGYYKPTTPLDPDSEYGVLVKTPDRFEEAAAAIVEAAK